jgi:hypothetical protein
MVLFNFWLNYILGFTRSLCFLLSWSLFCSDILSSSFCPPPLLSRRGQSGFIWYLHSFRCINRKIPRFHNTIIICECIWQIICNILQIYYFLNLKFNLLCTVDVSYAAPQAHGINNVALHWEYSPGIVFIFSQGRK